MSKKNLAHKLGKKGELFAKHQLIYYGLEILFLNFNVPKIGEIDIVARDGAILCFIEVKTRQESPNSTPSNAVNWHKRLTLWKAAMVYLRQIKAKSLAYRFDMFEVFAQKNKLKYANYLTHIFTKNDIKKVF